MEIDNNIKGIIFDMDGTLVDSMGVWFDVDRRFFESRNIPMTESIQKDIETLSMNDTAQYFIDHFDVDETIESLMDLWNDMAYASYKNDVFAKPGVKRFISESKERGIKMAIATNNSPKLVDICMKTNGLLDYIDKIVHTDEAERGKAFPDVYLLAATRLGVDPKDCIVFEDIPPGLKGAKAAGMTVVAVRDKYTMDVDELKREISDYYINDFTEVSYKK